MVDDRRQRVMEDRVKNEIKVNDVVLFTDRDTNELFQGTVERLTKVYVIIKPFNLPSGHQWRGNNGQTYQRKPNQVIVI